MSGYTELVSDLALILVVAGVVTIIFKRLKQPLVLGYIIAGILTGPYITFFSTVSNIESVEFWGKIGVVFLLFGLGLEFNFRKLKKVGGAGFTTVFFEALIMFSVGFILGKILGLHKSASLFLGGMLSISSTSIIIKAFDDLGIKNKKFTQAVFGALVVEDIVAVLMLVMLPALAVGKGVETAELMDKFLGLGIFLFFWFTIGIFFIPSLFRWMRNYLTDETVIIISLGLCLMMVAISIKAGVSEALGAFVMGSILSGSVMSEKIIKLTRPIKDFFGAIFFVSVGMLVDPLIVVKYWQTILIITLAILLAKPLSATIGFLFGGNTLRNSLQSGFCLCQIGEFSFIIAAVGKSLNVVDDYLYPVIVVVSIITTFITPYWIGFAEPVYKWLYCKSKPQWRRVMDRLGTGHTTLDEKSDWHKLIKSFVINITVYSLVMVVVIILFSNWINPLVLSTFGDGLNVMLLMCIANLLSLTPFLYGMLKRHASYQIYKRIWADQKFARGPLLFLMISKYCVALVFVVYTISYYVTGGYGAAIVVMALGVLIWFLSKYIKNYYVMIESRFLTNLNSESGGRRPFIIPNEIADEIHLARIEVCQNSFVAGRSIRVLHREKNTGAVVVAVARGFDIYNLPSNDFVLLPQDVVSIIGNDTQVAKFREAAEVHYSHSEQNSPASSISGMAEMELYHITLGEESPILGEHSNITNFMHKYGLLLVGIERSGNNALLKPNSTLLFCQGDTVWLVGDKLKINQLK